MLAACPISHVFLIVPGVTDSALTSHQIPECLWKCKRRLGRQVRVQMTPLPVAFHRGVYKISVCDLRTRRIPSQQQGWELGDVPGT